MKFYKPDAMTFSLSTSQHLWEIFMKNGVFCCTSLLDTCKICAKIKWSCSGSLLCTEHLTKPFYLRFPFNSSPVWTWYAISSTPLHSTLINVLLYKYDCRTVILPWCYSKARSMSSIISQLLHKFTIWRKSQSTICDISTSNSDRITINLPGKSNSHQDTLICTK